MNKILIFIALFSIILSSQAQDYETILPQGKIPKDFTTKSSSKYLEEISNLDKTEKKKTRKNKEDFYLVTNYNIDDFLLSGKVIFNDPITLYIDKVLKEILKNDQATYHALRIYTIKSDIPNAFTTNNGMIFVSIGLLAKLETEAQLAFILSHEVIHYKKKHVLENYLKDSRLESGKEYQKMSSNQKTIIKSSYSKELELAADTEGLELFLESSYQLESIEKVFDLLLVADQVIMDEEFNYSFLEDNDYVLEEDLKLTEFDTVQLNSDYEDVYNTHPNADKRKNNISSLLQGIPSEKRELFIISEREFNEAKQLAQFELIRQLSLNRDNKNAFYLAYSLLKSDSSLYLQKSIMKSLYGQYVKDEYEIEKTTVSFEVQKINHLFSEINDEEMGIIALRYALQLYENIPDPEIDFYIQDLTKRLINIFEESDSLTFVKNDSIDYSKAFSFIKDPAYLTEVLKKTRKEIENEEAWDKLNDKEKRKIAEKYPIEQTLVLNPYYTKINKKRKDAIRYSEAEEILLKMGDKIHEAADKLSMKADVLDMNYLEENSIIDFQHHSILSEWFLDKISSGASSISPLHWEMLKIAELYGTKHITWIGAIHIKDKKRVMFTDVFLSLWIPFYTPVLVMKVLNSGSYIYHFSFSFHVPTEGLSSADFRHIQSKNMSSIQESNIFYSMYKLKNRK